MPKISVIVPVYNVEKYLARCLDSLISQTASSFEIICVNDCSPDNSSAVLDQYASKYPDLITVITNKENLGLGLTRNEGLRIARGEYVTFVDSDDYVRSDYLETYLRQLEKNPVDIMVGGYIRVVDGQETTHIMSDSVWSITTYAIVCSKVYKKGFLDKNHLQFTNLKSGEDIYFSLEAYYCRPTFSVLKYAGYYYVFNRSSITGAMDYSRNYEQIMAQLFRNYSLKYDLSKVPTEMLHVIEYVYIANMINALITFNHGCGIRIMRQKYNFIQKDFHERFPNYKGNPFVGFVKPRGQTRKIRIGVGTVCFLARLHLDRLFFYAVALV